MKRFLTAFKLIASLNFKNSKVGQIKSGPLPFHFFLFLSYVLWFHIMAMVYVSIL